MSKINATYSGGYFISPDMDYRKLMEQRYAENKRKRELEERERRATKVKKDSDSSNVVEELVPTGDAVRQTFAIPFGLYCGHCHKRIARGTHVYTNRRRTGRRDAYRIIIWSLEIRCKFCQGLFYLETDSETPKETGGYHCVKNCRREDGDFAALNARNKAVREAWEEEERLKAESPLEAMERENQRARRLEEENREIQERVMARELEEPIANEGILEMLHAKKQQEETRAQQNTSKGSGSARDQMLRQLMGRTSASRHSAVPAQVITGVNGEELLLTAEEAAAAEAEYQRFEAERLLEQKRDLLQEQQQQDGQDSKLHAREPVTSSTVQALSSTSSASGVIEDVLSHYSSAAQQRLQTLLLPKGGEGAGSGGRRLSDSGPTGSTLEGAQSGAPEKSTAVVAATRGRNAFWVEDEEEEED